MLFSYVWIGSLEMLGEREYAIEREENQREFI